MAKNPRGRRGLPKKKPIGPMQTAGRAVDNFGKTVAGNYRGAAKGVQQAAKATKNAAVAGYQATKAGYQAASKKVGQVAKRYGTGDFRPEAKAIKSGANYVRKQERKGQMMIGDYVTGANSKGKSALFGKLSTQARVNAGRGTTYGGAALLGSAYAAGRGAFSGWTESKNKAKGEGYSTGGGY